MKPQVIIIVSEEGTAPEMVEVTIQDRVQAQEIVREAWRTSTDPGPTEIYPLWTWFIRNPLPLSESIDISAVP